MDNDIRTYPNEPAEERRSLAVRFFTAPAEVRTYKNLLYLALALPLGVFYFVFLLGGLLTGFGLTIVWVGLPILAVVFAGSFGMAALERRLAIHLLGARVPPMSAQRAAPGGLWQTVQELLANPVTWKGMAFLFVKFPVGLFSFVLAIVLLAVSSGFILAPVLYPWNDVVFGPWVVDSFGQALLLSAFGVVMMLASLNVLNLLAASWRGLAEAMLGSRRFEVPAVPMAPPALPA